MQRTICRLILGLLLATAPCLTVFAQHLTDRPSDNLLTRQDLQKVVDLQVERDAAALTDLLSDPDPAIRARAAFALASVQDSSAILALVERLGDTAPTVRADAAFALGQSSGRVPSQPLLQALGQHSDPTVQRRLIEALGKKGDRASLRQLVSRAWPDTLHAELALAVGRYAIRSVHAEEAVAYLLERLRGDDASACLNAAYYFARSRQTDPWQPLADSVRAVLDNLPLDDPTAMYLVAGIGRLEDPADTPRLLHWMKSAEDWRTRVNAARALARRTDEQGIRAALYDELVDPSVHVAVAAAQALNDGKAWSKADADIIKKWFQYNTYAWRITTPLLEALARQGDVEYVLDELDRRRGAPPLLAYARGLPALEYLPYNDAFDYLVNAAHSQNVRVAYAALSTLARRWREDRRDDQKHPAYLDVFAYGLQRKDLATVSASARVLADSLLRPHGGTEVLREVYEQFSPHAELDQMTTVLRALGASGDPDVVSFLRRELTHRHPVVNKAASDALETLTGVAHIPPTGIEPPERTINWSYLQDLGPHPRLVLETPKGTITLVLDAEQTPLTTQTLAQFARAGNFDNVPFHRVVPNFVIQGGDFARKDGFGGPPFSIRSEFTRIPYRRGTIGMASSGKDTEGSQYFITHSMQPHLDGRYTAFGTVIEGLEIVDTLYEDDRVTKATIIPDTN
ncbi:MAG: peptidylprolyl isomerase [Rhodothermales bacterium]